MKEIIACEHGGNCSDHCTRVYKIIPMELGFLRSQGLPLPRLCPNSRHIRRVKQKNPMKLWQRTCLCPGNSNHDHGAEACAKQLSTTYAPERSELIYCQACYQAELV